MQGQAWEPHRASCWPPKFVTLQMHADGASTRLQVPRPMIGTDAFQETPIVEVTRQITKHNYLVMDIADLPRVMKEVASDINDVVVLVVC